MLREHKSRDVTAGIINNINLEHNKANYVIFIGFTQYRD